MDHGRHGFTECQARRALLDTHRLLQELAASVSLPHRAVREAKCGSRGSGSLPSDAIDFLVPFSLTRSDHSAKVFPQQALQ
jgi:hypothetical protein